MRAGLRSPFDKLRVTTLFNNVVMLNLFQHPIIPVASCLAGGMPIHRLMDGMTATIVGNSFPLFFQILQTNAIAAL